MCRFYRHPRPPPRYPHPGTPTPVPVVAAVMYKAEYSISQHRKCYTIKNIPFLHELSLKIYSVYVPLCEQ